MIGFFVFRVLYRKENELKNYCIMEENMKLKKAITFITFSLTTALLSGVVSLLILLVQKIFTI